MNIDPLLAHAAKDGGLIVLGACHHWWVEYRPERLTVPVAQPRVCTDCRPDSPAAVGRSDQGLPLVPVTYLASWAEAGR